MVGTPRFLSLWRLLKEPERRKNALHLREVQVTSPKLNSQIDCESRDNRVGQRNINTLASQQGKIVAHILPKCIVNGNRSESCHESNNQSTLARRPRSLKQFGKHYSAHDTTMSVV